jgi:hypothetical protein
MAIKNDYKKYKERRKYLVSLYCQSSIASYDSATINQMLNMFKKKRCCIMILFSSSNFKPRQEAGDNL